MWGSYLGGGVAAFGFQSNVIDLNLQMETLEAAKQDKEIIALISLLAMGIKSVPRPVLRKKFADSGPILMSLLEQFTEHDNQNAIRSVSLQPFISAAAAQNVMQSLHVFAIDYRMHFSHFTCARIC